MSIVNRSGFTLLELIMVLVVISVVLALTSPTLRGFIASRQTADTAVTVLALTKEARSEAMASGRPCRLNIDAEAGTCYLTVQEAGAFISPKSEMGQRFSLPAGATVSLRADVPGAAAFPQRAAPGTAAPPAYVQFYPSGRGDPATIELKGRGGEVYQIVAPSATEAFRIISPAEARP